MEIIFICTIHDRTVSQIIRTVDRCEVDEQLFLKFTVSCFVAPYCCFGL